MTANANILYLLGAYPTWSETFIRRDLQMLLELGLPLVPAALFPGDVIRDPSWPEAVCLSQMPPLQDAAATARRHLTRLLPVSLRTALSGIRHRRHMQAVMGLCRERQIGHIHAEFADLPGLCGATVARRAGLSFSIGVHARDIHANKFSAAALYGEAAFISVCNRSAADALEELYPPCASRIELIHHGIDLHAWPYSETYEPPASPRFLFVGRLKEKKGVDTLVSALPSLLMHCPDARLVIVGDGPCRAALDALAARLGVAERIEWRGVAAHDTVKAEMRKSTALVAPSRIAPDGDRDGIPNVVVEAMALGLPVVGTDAGGLPEILTFQTAWPTPPEQPAALAAVLAEVVKNRTECVGRRRAARALVQAEFDAAVCVQRRAELLRQTLQRA